MRTPRGYDRVNWPYQADRALVEEYAKWLKQIPWRLSCTFTFAWPVSDPQGNNNFSWFINQLERH